jgi:hypothetical protein
MRGTQRLDEPDKRRIKAPVTRLALIAVLTTLAAGCSTDMVDDQSRVLPFGPFTVQPSQEIIGQCVQITLHNDTTLFVNQIEIETGPGFHHSNWFFVPDDDLAAGRVGVFPGPDGTFNCEDRGFDQIEAALRGGVLFAQSTQSEHDVQAFPDGVALKVPAHSKLVATIHLLNATDQPLHLTPKLTLTQLPENQVTTVLAGLSFENHALALPPNKRSSFALDCDLTPAWQKLYNLGNVPTATPSFKLYYALAHYHALGTGLTIDGVRPDGTSARIFSTDAAVGDALGSTLSPTFDMTGFTRMRFSCDYFNSTAQTVGWGLGDQEMCVFLAFTDSDYFWAGGALGDDGAGDGTMTDGVMSFQHQCSVYSADSTR